jgi:hypothetical protein
MAGARGPGIQQHDHGGGSNGPTVADHAGRAERFKLGSTSFSGPPASPPPAAPKKVYRNDGDLHALQQKEKIIHLLFCLASVQRSDGISVLLRSHISTFTNMDVVGGIRHSQ